VRTRILMAAMAFAAIGGTLNAQDQRRRMTFVGGGDRDRGKCTVEVVVDGSAEVEIRDDTAILRNLGGATPRWKRFECTGAFPRNPAGFRFAGVDGRGRQQLVREPGNGGAAVIRIDDPDSGSEGYTFDIFWGNAPPPPPPIQSRGDDRDRNDRRDARGPDQGPDRDGDAFHHDREEAFRGDAWKRRLFARVREDLDHVQAETFPFGSDEFRLVRAKQELDQLQDLLARGRYDRRELDDVLMALGKVVADNRLAPRDREILNDDLNRLRDFRANTRDYGIR
jgi:hypothetical protein